MTKNYIQKKEKIKDTASLFLLADTMDVFQKIRHSRRYDIPGDAISQKIQRNIYYANQQ